MFSTTKNRHFNLFYRGIAMVVVTAFMATSIIPPQKAYAQFLNLPEPGTMVRITPEFQPAVIKGIKIDPNNPLLFNFLIDPGQIALSDSEQRVEYRKLIKYFLAALTTPEKDMWVNLSPYEHNRMTSKNLGHTEMGRDMLAQDYILKQLTASLIYPEESLGKKFWDTVYERVRMEAGSTNVPVNTFNKVWIIPDKATVFEKGNVAIVLDSHMKVLMEQDFLSLDKHANLEKMGLNSVDDGKFKSISATSSNVVREIIIPAIEKEVNEGKNFAKIRQIYNSMILASWFKQRLKMHLLSKVYVNKNENAGVELQNPQDNERIYQDYLKAFKKGVFNYIKEDTDPSSGEAIPRKYFSGGADYSALAEPIGSDHALIAVSHNTNAVVAAEGSSPLKNVAVQLNAANTSQMTNSNGVVLTPQDLTLPADQLSAKIVSFIASNNANDSFQALLFLANANDDPELGKDFVVSLKDIKGIVKNGLATWGGNPQDIAKVAKFLVKNYLNSPEVQAKKNIAFSASSNVWKDLHFQSFLSGLAMADSRVFANALRSEFEKMADDQPVGSVSEKAFSQLAKRVANNQAKYETGPLNVTAQQWFAENQSSVQVLPEQVDENALAAAYQASLEQEGVSSEEAAVDAQNASDILQLDFNFLSQVSITRNDLVKMYGAGNEWKVKALLEKHDGFLSKTLDQQIAILLNEAMNLGIWPTDLINAGYDPTLVLTTALTQGYTPKSLRAAVDGLQNDTQRSASIAFLESPEAVQLASDALQAENVVEQDVDTSFSNSESSFSHAFKGSGFFKSLFPKFAAAAVFIATASNIFASNVSDQISALKSKLSNMHAGYYLTADGRKDQARLSALEAELKAESATNTPVTPVVQTPAKEQGPGFFSTTGKQIQLNLEFTANALGFTTATNFTPNLVGRITHTVLTPVRTLSRTLIVGTEHGARAGFEAGKNEVTAQLPAKMPSMPGKATMKKGEELTVNNFKALMDQLGFNQNTNIESQFTLVGRSLNTILTPVRAPVRGTIVGVKHGPKAGFNAGKNEVTAQLPAKMPSIPGKATLKKGEDLTVDNLRALMVQLGVNQNTNIQAQFTFVGRALNTLFTPVRVPVRGTIVGVEHGPKAGFQASEGEVTAQLPNKMPSMPGKATLKKGEDLTVDNVKALLVQLGFDVNTNIESQFTLVGRTLDTILTPVRATSRTLIAGTEHGAQAGFQAGKSEVTAQLPSKMPSMPGKVTLKNGEEITVDNLRALMDQLGIDQNTNIEAQFTLVGRTFDTILTPVRSTVRGTIVGVKHGPQAGFQAGKKEVTAQLPKVGGKEKVSTPTVVQNNKPENVKPWSSLTYFDENSANTITINNVISAQVSPVDPLKVIIFSFDGKNTSRVEVSKSQFQTAKISSPSLMEKIGLGFKWTQIIKNNTNAPVGSTIIVYKNNQEVKRGAFVSFAERASGDDFIASGIILDGAGWVDYNNSFVYKVVSPGQAVPQGPTVLAVSDQLQEFADIVNTLGEDGFHTPDQLDRLQEIAQSNVGSDELASLVQDLRNAEIKESKSQVKKVMVKLVEATKVITAAPAASVTTAVSPTTEKKPNWVQRNILKPVVNKYEHVRNIIFSKSTNLSPGAKITPEASVKAIDVTGVMDFFKVGDTNSNLTVWLLKDVKDGKGTKPLTKVRVISQKPGPQGIMVYTIQGIDSKNKLSKKINVTAWDLFRVETKDPNGLITPYQFPTASAHKADVGGIDFDSKYLQLNLQGDAINIPIPKGFNWLLTTPIRGFNPQILNIRSGVGFDLSFFKGLVSPQDEQSAKANLPKPAGMNYQLAMKEWAVEEQVQTV